jgi:hypothetical protein
MWRKNTDDAVLGDGKTLLPPLPSILVWGFPMSSFSGRNMGDLLELLIVYDK